ncbi:hypothetical protein [Sagittula sp. S175]|uniref:hypothetical protein n=1 Tax=Sagittula sp. S175 TaxID=3415129 RepID=UPI003C7ED3BA
MSEVLFILFLIVLPPLGLAALSQLSHWRIYRLGSLWLLALWFFGMAIVLSMPALCDGNILYGYRNCRGLSTDVAEILTAAGLLATVAAAALYALLTLTLGIRALRARLSH